MKTLNVRRILTLAAILSLAVYYALTWTNMLDDLYERTGSDFMGFYTFGRISQSQGYPSIYKIEEQQKLQEEIVGHSVTPIFYTHLPFIAPLARLLVVEDYIVSFKRWALVLLFLNALNVYLLMNLLQVSSFTKWNLVVLGLGAYLFDPTFSGFMNGQDTAILLTGAALWAYGLFSKEDFPAGLGLSLTTVRPQIALFLAIPFLFHRRRVLWGFVLGGSTLALISLGLLGKDGTLRFIESIRYIEGTVWRENHALDMPTISGIIRRNFTVSNYEPIQKMVWLCYALGIAAFGLWWRKLPALDERHIGLLSLSAIFFVPYAHYHDLILLLIPIFCLIRFHQRLGLVHQNYLVLLPLTVSWLLNIGFAGSGQWKFPMVYTIMALLAYFLVRAEKIPLLKMGGRESER
ncbi:MAG: glycosyltransferase family 87 protein [Chloroflexota bacterium]